MTWAFAGSAGLSGTQSASGNTIVTDAFSVSAGELVVVGFRWEGTAGDTITGSISDGGAGLTWSTPQYIGTSSGETQRQAVMWAVAEATGNLTLTWTFAGGATRTYRTWQAHRYTFADGFTLADSSSAQNGANVSAWTTGEYTVAAGDLAVVFLAHFNANQQPQTPSDFSVGYDSGLYDSYYRIYAAGGNFSAGAGWVGGNESYAAIALIFSETGATYTLSAEAGSYITSGADASLLFNRAIAADAGAYSLTGIDTALLRGYSMPAESGSYALSGTDASLAFNRVLVAESGSYTLSGADAALTYTPFGSTYTLAADQGSYSQTGTEASLLFNRVISADGVSYSLSGTDAALLRGFFVSAEGGSYALTGVDAAFSIKYILAAESGSYGLTGSDATLDYSGASTWTTQPNASSIWSAQPNSSSAWAVQSDNSTTWTVQ